MTAFLPLTNTPIPNAWGRIDGVAQALGWEPTGAPEAELWLGAHPLSPARFVDVEPWGDLQEWEQDAHTRLPYLLAASNTPAVMAPYGGRSVAIGNNPFALAAPRASQTNSATSLAEPHFYNSPLAHQLTSQFGEQFRLATGPILPLDNYPGDATALQVLGNGVDEAIAEPVRLGGGSALTVHPSH